MANEVINRAKTTARTTTGTVTCHHYWIIESPSGPTSRGVCKRCGAIKEFYNSAPGEITVWTRSNVHRISADDKSYKRPVDEKGEDEVEEAEKEFDESDMPASDAE